MRRDRTSGLGLALDPKRGPRDRNGKGACIIASGYHGSVNLSLGDLPSHVLMTRSSLALETESAILALVPPGNYRKRFFAKIGEVLGLSPRTVRSIVHGEWSLGERSANAAAAPLRDYLYEESRRLRYIADALDAEIIESKRQMEQNARRSDNSHAPGLALARRQVAQDRSLGSSQSQATHAHGRPMRQNARAFAHHVRSHEVAA